MTDNELRMLEGCPNEERIRGYKSSHTTALYNANECDECLEILRQAILNNGAQHGQR